MVKKKKQSLTERIAALINRVGEKPEPTFGDIKSELVEWLDLAETLENGSVIRDSEAKVTVLEAALKKTNLENSNLQAELQSLKTEVDRFRAEWKKQEDEKKREDIPDIQLQILRGLPTEHSGDGATLKGICRRAKIPPDEAEIHLNWLEKSRFAERRYFAIGGGESRIAAWYRTIRGNELILAKRLAGEEEPAKRNARKHLELSQMETTVLLTVAKQEGMTPPEIVEQVNKSIPTIGKPIASLPTVLIILVTLRGKNLVTNEDGRWSTLTDGVEYLADRGL
jgi:hypothetical protein